ncbi:MAG TPA: methyltransferase domain-containing protein [Myxococcota bacterium]|nr:methyltransferase domain-containing protein [Myxococcota bacterium]
MSPPETCLLCGSTRHRAIFNEHGTDVLRCRDCRHVFSAHDADADFAGYWGEVVKPGEWFWRDAHEAMYEAFFELMVTEPKGRLLDVGCGLGHFVKAMQDRFPIWETWGCEISPVAVRFAADEVGAANVRAGRVEDAGFPPESFDLVTMWDVFEHLKEPERLLRHLRGLLRPGGALFLHTPNAQVQVPKAVVKRWLLGMKTGRHYLVPNDHLHVYTPRTARTLIERNGFEVRFVHLPPIQEAVDLPGPLFRGLKNAWAASVRGLDRATGGRVNLDNLFVIARRPAAASGAAG